MRIAALLIVSLICFIPATLARAEYATVLIVLEPRKPGGGHWDIFKGADLALCVEKGCYISRGYKNSARFFSGRSALIPGIRAAFCRNSLKCIYRNVKLEKGYGVVQPIDLDSVDHDFMTRKAAYIDESCIFAQGRIHCKKGLYTAEYSMWIIPEAVAEAGGSRALDYAVFKGLHESKIDYISDFLKQERQTLPKIVSDFYQLILGRQIPRFCSADPAVIAEAFYISGIIKPEDRRRGHFFEKFVNADPLDDILKTVRLEPQMFWKFHSSIGELKELTSAEIVQRVDGTETVRLLANERGKKSLLIGWPVKSRAKGVIEDCLNRSS